MARKPKSGPASDPEVLILSSLVGGPKHGYAILADIETFVGDRMGPGTLYAAITRLVDKEWIAPESVAGRQRPYRLTDTGAACLEELLKNMRRVARIGLCRRCSSPDATSKKRRPRNIMTKEPKTLYKASLEIVG